MRNQTNYNKEYYRKHKKKLLKKARAYAKSDPERTRKWAKAWAKRNPDKILENKRNFRIVRRKLNTNCIKRTIEVLEKLLITIE